MSLGVGTIVDRHYSRYYVGTIVALTNDVEEKVSVGRVEKVLPSAVVPPNCFLDGDAAVYLGVVSVVPPLPLALRPLVTPTLRKGLPGVAGDAGVEADVGRWQVVDGWGLVLAKLVVRVRVPDLEGHAVPHRDRHVDWSLDSCENRII